MRIYLDESEDLGFKFEKSATSRYFVVTLLTTANDRPIKKAVERTIKNKINRGKTKSKNQELKGSKTEIGIKRYLYKQIAEHDFKIYSLVLNKMRVYDYLQKDKPRLYNFVSRILVEQCNLSSATEKIILTLDKSKNKKEQQEFNHYLLSQLEGHLSLNIPLEVYHVDSKSNKAIQAVDMFSWGLYRKYEYDDKEWYDMFASKIKFEEVYLPGK